MREYERTVLRERLAREGATVGAQIPEHLTIDGEERPIRREVLQLAGLESPSDSDRAQANQLKRDLRRIRRELIDRLEDDSCTFEEGEELVDTVSGIDRALNALKDIGEPSVEEQARQQETINQRRWMSFLREALGHEQTERRR